MGDAEIGRVDLPKHSWFAQVLLAMGMKHERERGGEGDLAKF
jgi:hypothetical protein